jgi:outer membrane protein TolC
VQGAQRNYSLLRDEVVNEVMRNLRNLRAYKNSITIQQEQIQQAKGQLELAQVKFKWGLANNFDLIDAETKLLSAQTNLLSAVINYILGTDQLRASMGTLLERPEKF